MSQPICALTHRNVLVIRKAFGVEWAEHKTLVFLFYIYAESNETTSPSLTMSLHTRLFFGFTMIFAIAIDDWHSIVEYSQVYVADCVNLQHCCTVLCLTIVVRQRQTDVMHTQNFWLRVHNRLLSSDYLRYIRDLRVQSARQLMNWLLRKQMQIPSSFWQCNANKKHFSWKQNTKSTIGPPSKNKRIPTKFLNESWGNNIRKYFALEHHSDIAI